MKTNISILSYCRGKCWGLVWMVTLLLFSFGTSGSRAAAFDSPAGDWDCITQGGGQDGITFLTFSTTLDTNNLFTFSGFSALAGTRSLSQMHGQGRNPGGNPGRGGSGSSGTNEVINLFGSTPISGNWFFDARGRIVGSFFDVINATALQTNFMQTCVTTDEVFTVNSTNGALPYQEDDQFQFCFTNGPTFATNFLFFIVSTNDGNVNFYNVGFTFANTNFTITPIGTTNAVSFVGTVTPNKRLTLVANTLFGKVTYQGIPLVPVTVKQAGVSLDGSTWIGTKSGNGQSQLESFTLTATIVPNFFLMDGQGSTYEYNNPPDPTQQSVCMISRQGKIAFLVDEIPLGSSEGNLRVTIGEFINSAKTTGARTKGVESPDFGAPVHFNATLLPDGPLGP